MQQFDSIRCLPCAGASTEVLAFVYSTLLQAADLSLGFTSCVDFASCAWTTTSCMYLLDKQSCTFSICLL